MATIEIRPFVESDVGPAERIERAVYPEPWGPGVFEDELAQSNRVYKALCVDDRLVGYGGVMMVGDEAHITTVVVDPGQRQSRLGTRLMAALVEAAVDAGARSLTLEVRSSNTVAQALYRRFGMAPVGVRKRYYRDEDALIMWVHDIDGPEFRDRLDEIKESL